MKRLILVIAFIISVVFAISTRADDDEITPTLAPPPPYDYVTRTLGVSEPTNTVEPKPKATKTPTPIYDPYPIDNTGFPKPLIEVLWEAILDIIIMWR
jgi:hypothetical protein